MTKQLITCLLMLTSLHSFSQDDGRTMSPILKEALPLIEKIESDGYEIVRMEYDILNSEKSTYRTLQEGWTYGILAFGDYRVEDIDVEVYKQVGDDWSLISKDTDADSRALVNIKPFYTGMYKIVVRGYKFVSGSNGCHYGLIVFHQ